ncbi:MAG: hypothetical protein SAQ54_25645, partial [Oscillatoria sp. PMC 1050.18]|nr:hypothetical protein [Oscillatoria sp. PMC 1050.18]
MLLLDFAIIPPGINTIEQLVVWGLCGLAEKYPNKSIVEVQGEAPQLMVTCSPFYVTSADRDWNYNNHY